MSIFYPPNICDREYESHRLNSHDALNAQPKLRCEKKSRQGEHGLLSSEGAALCETSLSTSRLAEDCRAASADDDGLCVREDGGDCEAAGALDIHEEGSRSRDKVLGGKISFWTSITI